MRSGRREGRQDGFGYVSPAERHAAGLFAEGLMGEARAPRPERRPLLRLPPPAEHDPDNAPDLRPGAVGPGVNGILRQAHIAIVSPSSAFTVTQAIRQRFVDTFLNLGRDDVSIDFAPNEPSPGFQEADHTFAGTDARRSAALQFGLFDPSRAAVIASSGGHGATRVLDELLDRVTTAKAGRWPRVPPLAELFPPRRIVGFSDFTAVLLAAYSLLGWASLHGPMLCCFNQPSLERLVRAMTVPPRRLDRNNLLAGNLTLLGRLPGDSVRGVMLGGNLSLVDALYGSPFFPSLQGGILFVEEVNELGRKIDRMIEGLKHRGAARQVRAVVVGQIVADAGTQTITEREVATLFHRSWNKPVAFGLPAGHGQPNRAFWVGLEYEMKARAGGRADLFLRP